MIKFSLYLVGLIVLCGVGPVLLWLDYTDGDWFWLVADGLLVLYVGDFLIQGVKRS